MANNVDLGEIVEMAGFQIVVEFFFSAILGEPPLHPAIKFVQEPMAPIPITDDCITHDAFPLLILYFFIHCISVLVEWPND